MVKQRAALYLVGCFRFVPYLKCKRPDSTVGMMIAGVWSLIEFALTMFRIHFLKDNSLEGRRLNESLNTIRIAMYFIGRLPLASSTVSTVRVSTTLSSVKSRAQVESTTYVQADSL